MSDRNPGVWLSPEIVRVAPNLSGAVILAQLIWMLDRPRAATIIDLQGHRWVERADTAWEYVGLSRTDAYRGRKALERAGLIAVHQTTNGHGRVTLLRPQPATTASAARAGSAHPRDGGSAHPRDGGSAHPRDGVARIRAMGSAHPRDPKPASQLSSELVTKQEPSSSDVFDADVDAETTRSAPLPEDVERLCLLLAELIESNGSKRPVVTETWRLECERLIRLDGRSPDAVEHAIRWSQSDPFWRANVLSMPTLRRQYDRLRLHAKRDGVSRESAQASASRPVGQDAVEAFFQKRGLFDERSPSVVDATASEAAAR